MGHHIQIMNRFILDQKYVCSVDSEWNYTKKKEKRKKKNSGLSPLVAIPQEEGIGVPPLQEVHTRLILASFSYMQSVSRIDKNITW